MGKYLSNSHTEFKLDGVPKDAEIYAIECLFLRKTYVYILEPTGIHGNIVNAEHIRARGAPTKCINTMLNKIT